MTKCKRCGSYAINAFLRDQCETGMDLCDVCYWRQKAESEAARCANYCDQIEHLLSERNQYRAAAKAANQCADYWTEQAATLQVERDLLAREIGKKEHDCIIAHDGRGVVAVGEKARNT